MYHEYTQDELRQYCRRSIETLELWARRLIHEKMTEKYGTDFINKQLADGNYVVKKEIRQHVSSMLEKKPERYNRAVDTLFLDQIIYFLCHPNWYSQLFQPALKHVYRCGKDEAREILERLISIRNPLSHSNPISMHDVERAICYSHDFVEGLKKYYKDRGEEQVWNVPKIIKVTDSLGNVFDNLVENTGLGAHVTIPQQLHCGDTYSIEVEIDSSFSPDKYQIVWQKHGHDMTQWENSTKMTITFGLKDVDLTSLVTCRVIQNKEWHKFGRFDSQVNVRFTVLPPQ